VILSIDEQGAMAWHLPAPQTPKPAGEERRGRAQQRFLIPTKRVVPPAPPAADTDARRSIFGAVARKLLKVLVYPITDPILGAIGAKFAEMWEGKNRPYGLRTFTPENYKDPAGAALAPADFTRLAQGRALLFIHGTFSTAHGAFFGLCDNVMTDLHARYHGRIFAFNHFTLSHDPRRNAKWFLDQLPADCNLEVDIVCHSRGGLVARSIAERGEGASASPVTVKRVVFAGVPNAGTLLADKDHMVQMIDRLTTVTNLFPTGPITEFLEGLITAVKVLGHAGLGGLPGLASMDPRGDFIKRINGSAAVDVVAYAIAADYEPTDAALQSLILAKVADAIVDRIFEKAANDLVVPQLGVFDKNGGMGFPIPPSQVLKIDKGEGVMHTTLFGHKPTCDKILEWLTEA
jgi:pimeloyl-ACP methyl ester carboxylesterase